MINLKFISKRKLQRRRRGFLRNRKGSVAVEFAFVFPLFVMFLFGIIDVGRAYWVFNTLQEAAESTARHAMVNEGMSLADIETWGSNNIIALNPTDVTFSATGTTVGSDYFLKVDATYNFKFLVGIVFSAAAVDLTGSSRVPDLFVVTGREP